MPVLVRARRPCGSPRAGVVRARRPCGSPRAGVVRARRPCGSPCAGVVRARRPCGSPRAGVVRARRPCGSPRAGSVVDQGRDVVEVRRARERGEDLAAGDEETALHGHGPGGDAAGRARAHALRERLAVEVALLDDTPEELGPHLVVPRPLVVGHVEQVRHLARPQHRGRVHVEGQAGGAAVPADLLRHPDVVGEAGAEPAVGLGDAEAEEAPVAEVVEVLPRERRLPVVDDGPLLHHRAQVGDQRDELLPGTAHGPSLAAGHA